MLGNHLKRRSAAVAALALVLAFIAGTLTAFSLSGAPAGAVVGGDRGQVSRAGKVSKLALHDAMRKLWEEHVTWTRLAIVEFAAGAPGFDSTATRLQQNQTDIGNAVKPFFGDRAGDRLAALLHDHITISTEILKAAKAGDTEALNKATARWYANANDIADFLHALNPRFWPRATMRDLMKVHLDQTLAEANHILKGDFGASVNDYDAIETHILKMADTLSYGIIAAFPGRFR